MDMHAVTARPQPQQGMHHACTARHARPRPQQGMHSPACKDHHAALCRYGTSLSAEELASFSVLAFDFEVAFLLKQLAPPTAPAGARASDHGLSSIAKNRRLAHMHQLREGGEYFAVEAMQARDPLLYYPYLGRFTGEAEPGTGEECGRTAL
jgi:hypothetical protein